MSKKEFQQLSTSYPRLREISPIATEASVQFRRFLPSIARGLIAANFQLQQENNWKWFHNPDEVQGHQPRFHQWGVITHTDMVMRGYKGEANNMLQAWGASQETFGLDRRVKQYFDEEIDGIQKGQLFELAIIAHDLGKFAIIASSNN